MNQYYYKIFTTIYDKGPEPCLKGINERAKEGKAGYEKNINYRR